MDKIDSIDADVLLCEESPPVKMGSILNGIGDGLNRYWNPMPSKLRPENLAAVGGIAGP
jgi:hypothetical protein